ncbi:DUF4231 domain-containing protein [Lactococcus garvieae subsp. garvieae]|uniref:DUF4231 domain-containing protein n=1 Tax=Lactococcus garvieae TaxID=1363 RepID=UPI0005A84947|nr:DUF4231 domain-containing protein [Lactococcus garvieae]KAA8710011.1 DUF4231 domain-containing protein [Lactococcus garvieae subsp. garvieae]MDG6192203.1 DUF4231 domain-containing protein [Lactococcus garvieae]PCS00261.1 hypothetical protein RU85_GL000946 [Lactococcus garvieae]QPR49272.1 DUF4231 domain-containing protein [Lactococcus garvieae]
MKEGEYLKTRLDDQLNWYDKKSQRYKKAYLFSRITSIILAILIPLFSGLAKDFGWWIFNLIAVIGAVIALIEGVSSLLKYQENWISYRTIAETLKHEKYMFLTKTGVYKDVESPFTDLVERVETIISSENVNWANLQQNEKGKK